MKTNAWHKIKAVMKYTFAIVTMILSTFFNTPALSDSFCRQLAKIKKCYCYYNVLWKQEWLFQVKLSYPFQLPLSWMRSGNKWFISPLTASFACRVYNAMATAWKWHKIPWGVLTFRKLEREYSAVKFMVLIAFKLVLSHPTPWYLKSIRQTNLYQILVTDVPTVYWHIN